MLFVYFLVAGTWLVRHRALTVDGAALFDEGANKGAFSAAALGLGAGVTLVAVEGTRQACGLRFDTTPGVAFASRFVASTNPAWPAVEVVLRSTRVVALDMLGVVAAPPDKRTLALCARLPPDLLYACATATRATLASAVVAAIPTLLGSAKGAAFAASRARELPLALAACGWYQVGYATPESPLPDAITRVAFADPVAALVAAMIDPERPAGAPTSRDFCLDRAALLCLDGAPLARTIATTLFGEGGCATSTAAWYDSVLACAA
jgi:hypothetical protein